MLTPRSASSTPPSPSSVASGDDRPLVERIREGDTAAFEGLFLETFGGLCMAVIPYAESRAVAEEIVQDLFLAVWQKRASFEVRGSIPAYLYASALNRARNIRRRSRLETRWELAETDRADGTAEPADRSLEEAELAAALQRAIEHLPPKGREIFLLNRNQHLTYDQVAAQLGISVKTVETHMGRALRALKQSLAIFLP